MSRSSKPLTNLVWSPALAGLLADTHAALARLDARLSVTSLAQAWHLRAAWNGYATALQLEGFEVEEIDIIARACAFQMPGRPRLETVREPFAAFESWHARLRETNGRHWREDLPFTFETPTGWEDAPAVVRALALLDNWTCKDRTIAPWLAFPSILHRMGITARPLPCLIVGDRGQRFACEDRPALLKRLLKQLRRSAEDGLARLDQLEKNARSNVVALRAERRPGKLAELVPLAFARPCLAARSLAPLLDLTISGAGKLLERATRLGLLVEISRRSTWRTYVSHDIAQALGLIAPPRGRPRGAPPASPALDAVLAAFDEEMAELDKRLARLDSGNGGRPPSRIEG